VHPRTGKEAFSGTDRRTWRWTDGGLDTIRPGSILIVTDDRCDVDNQLD
jgi:hypothetical protein